MGIDKQSSKNGNYVGGFLQLFDWKAKSRKKLFSSKSDITEQSKQKKGRDGNSLMTRLQMLDEDAGSSIKESSDYSCTSSVNDEDFYGTKGPGVVARLMGLDSLPKSNSGEPYSTPLFDSQSLRDSYSRTKNLEYCRDPQIMHSVSLLEASVGKDVYAKHQNVVHRPFEKFQTEVLPPKSAKSVPVTHHKLLSPIKSINFIPSEDAAQIMEAAVRIIEPRSRTSTKTKLPTVGASSVRLKVRDSKEKVQTAQRPVKFSEVPQKAGESSATKPLGRPFLEKSSNGSIDATCVESSVAQKNQGKSISLALLAKANVQKREGLNMNSSKTLVVQKETSETSPTQTFNSQSTTQKSSLKKPCSSVLRQNNQKQNCIVDQGNLSSKNNLQGDASSARQRNSSKASKLNSRKLSIEVKDDKREVMSSSSERVTRKKRSIDRNYHYEKNQATQKGLRSSAQSNWDQDSGSDVVSFTFTAPLTRLAPGYGGSMETGENCSMVAAESRSKCTLQISDGMSASKLSFPEQKFKGSDDLSALLEQKLEELTRKVEFSQQKPALHDMVPGSNASVSVSTHEGDTSEVGLQIDDPGVLKETSMRVSNISQARKILDCRLPSPVSVHSAVAESWNSTESADSNSMEDGQQSSTVHAHEVRGFYSGKAFCQTEGYAELSDSPSISAGSVAKRHETTITLTNHGKSNEWELEYIKEVLCNIELMFKNYVSGHTCEIIDPRFFDELEYQKGYFSDFGPVPRINQRILFDCVSECLDLKCRKYAGGGCALWAKGILVVKRKERLVEGVYKEVQGWRALGGSMVDELVDNDMGNHHGRWLDFEVEAFEVGVLIQSRILSSLIDEVVADMLAL